MDNADDDLHFLFLQITTVSDFLVQFFARVLFDSSTSGEPAAGQQCASSAYHPNDSHSM